jgi:hypothetical protein
MAFIYCHNIEVALYLNQYQHNLKNYLEKNGKIPFSKTAIPLPTQGTNRLRMTNVTMEKPRPS